MGNILQIAAGVLLAEGVLLALKWWWRKKHPFRMVYRTDE